MHPVFVKKKKKKKESLDPFG